MYSSDQIHRLVSSQPNFEERIVAKPVVWMTVVVVEGQKGRGFQTEGTHTCMYSKNKKIITLSLINDNVYSSNTIYYENLLTLKSCYKCTEKGLGQY